MTPSCPNFGSIRNPLARGALLAATWPGLAFAVQPAAAQPTTSLLGEVLAIVLPLLLIIAGLVAVLVIARRRFGLTGKDAPLSIVQILPVGPRERIVLVRTRAGRVLAVGVAAQSLTLLAQLDHDDIHVKGHVEGSRGQREDATIDPAP